MYKVKNSERKNIAPLFVGIDDSMVIAYLQGYQGDGYVDDIKDPTIGMIISGEYSFYGGDPKFPKVISVLNHLFDYIDGDETVGIFADTNSGWEKTLLSVNINNPIAVPRFGIAQKDYDFNIDLLTSIIEKMSSGLDLKPFDENLYKQALNEEWSNEFCETFESAEDYLKKGFGYAITKDNILVSGTSTIMTVYDGGTEIQVATKDIYRKQGLAIITAAAFIIECTRRGIRPCWDAANEASLHMALKLGYEYKGEYTTIKMVRSN